LIINTIIVYIFAEIAAYKEGFKEGIRFLTNILSSTDDSGKPKRHDSVEIFVAGKVFLCYTYRM